MNNKITYRFFFIIASVLLLAACGSSSSGGDPVPPPDTTAPTGVVMQADGFLDASAVVVITFDESMDTTSQVISGDLAGDSDAGVWSTTTLTNDTLTLTPPIGWSFGANQTLIVDAMDPSGNAAPSLTATYDIAGGTLYYVSSAAANDMGDGLSPGTAKRTIMAAINAATTPATVMVNAGTYDVDSNAALFPSPTHVNLKEGVFLLGGYSADFMVRDPSVNISMVNDLSTALVGPGTAHRALEANGITSSTLVDGFTFNGTPNGTGSAWTTAGFVHNGATVIIQNSIFNAGTGANNVESIGLYIVDASPTIRNNTVHGGSSNQNTEGIYNYEFDMVSPTEPIIIGNTVYGGDATNASFGIYSRDGAVVTMRGNTIDGGTGSSSSAIYSTQSTITILNNMITGGNNPAGSVSGISSFNCIGLLIDGNQINAGVGTNAWGISNSSSSGTVSRNHIYGGDSMGGFTYGIANSGSGMLVMDIHNNTIHGGSTPAGSTHGIANDQGSPSIRNNTIDGGDGSINSYGIANELFGAGTSTPAIDNNIIFTSGGATNNYCIYEGAADGDPASVRNNNLFSCATALYRDDDTGLNLLGVDGGGNLTENANGTGTVLATPAGTGNVSVDMTTLFADIDGFDDDMNTHENNDWRLGGAAPTSVTQGGLNGIDEAWSFDDDQDGVLRPGTGQSWAIGAFEP